MDSQEELYTLQSKINTLKYNHTQSMLFLGTGDGIVCIKDQEVQEFSNFKDIHENDDASPSHL